MTRSLELITVLIELHGFIKSRLQNTICYSFFFFFSDRIFSWITPFSIFRRIFGRRIKCLRFLSFFLFCYYFKMRMSSSVLTFITLITMSPTWFHTFLTNSAMLKTFAIYSDTFIAFWTMPIWYMDIILTYITISKNFKKLFAERRIF